MQSVQPRMCRHAFCGSRRPAGSASGFQPISLSSATTSRSSECSSKGARVSSAEHVAATSEPGARFLEEIREQPDALLRLLERDAEFARVAGEIRERGATTIRMVGHGSSDNAASYGVYAFGLLPGWTALRDSISLT